MKSTQSISFLPRFADFALGVCLAGCSLLLPLPGDLRPAFPAAILLVFFLLRPGTPFLSSGPAFYLGFALGPVLLAADLSVGSPLEWGLCTGGGLLLPVLLLFLYRRERLKTLVKPSCLAAAFLFGAQAECIRAASAVCLHPFAGDGPAARVALSSALALFFGLGLLIGDFACRRAPGRVFLWSILGLFLTTACCLIYIHPSSSLYAMAFRVHVPDDDAVAFAAGNLMIAIRISGLSMAALGATFSVALYGLGWKKKNFTPLFLAWSAGFLLLKLLPLEAIPFIQPFAGPGLVAGLPAALLGSVWLLLIRPLRPLRAGIFILASLVLVCLVTLAQPREPLSSSCYPSPAVYEAGERFDLQPEFIAGSRESGLLRLYSPDDEQVLARGMLLADSRLCYRFSWQKNLTNLVRCFSTHLAGTGPVRLLGREREFISPLPAEMEGDIKDNTRPEIFLPSTLREDEGSLPRILDAFEDSTHPVAAVFDLSTLSRESLMRICSSLAAARQDIAFWIEPPFLMAAAGTAKGPFELRDPITGLPPLPGMTTWDLPTPIPSAALVSTMETTTPACSPFTSAIRLELPDRRGPFPDPRVAASHLTALIASQPLPPCGKNLTRGEAFLFRRSILLSAALRRYQGRFADEVRLLNVLAAQFPRLDGLHALKDRAMAHLEADRRRWIHLYEKDASDADARIGMGRHLVMEGDPEGIYHIKMGCELRETLTEAFEESLAGFAEMLRSAVGEPRRHQLLTVNSLFWYAGHKKHQTPRVEAFRGMAHLHGGEMEKAIEFLSLAREHDPGLALAHQGLASAFLAAGRNEEALESAKEAIRLDPHEPEPWLILAKTLGNLKPSQSEEIEKALSRYFLLKGSAEALAAPDL